jgi:ferrochelatase
MKSKKGLLLLNLGTPDSPKPEAVGRYLKQFLMDKRVIDIAWPLRWFFVNVLIVPKRKFASGEAYEKIWTEKGSPLLYHLKDLANEVEGLMKGNATLANYDLEIGMRYGNPSVENALKRFKERGTEEITVFPMYPQYAESSTLSSQEEVTRAAAALGLKAKIQFVPAFYKHPAFIQAFATRLQQELEREKPDHVLMSFHGLPVRHVRHTDKSGGQHCMRSPNCCDQITDVNRDCYRAQSYATARALAKATGLTDDQYTVSFQSRLGRAEWIPPYTDHKYKELVERGVKKLVVVCPSFVADCLETIEEIGIRGAAEFRGYGGDRCVATPCLNSDPEWARAVVTIAAQASGENRT